MLKCLVGNGKTAKIFVVAFAIAPPVLASEECAVIEESEARLACYDAAWRSARVETPLVEGSAWKVTVDRSPVDDSSSVFLRSEAIDTMRTRFGLETTRPFLLLRCSENTTAAYIGISGAHLADIQGYGDVTLRVDDKRASNQAMDASTDNQALGLWSGGSAIPFIKSLIGAETLLVRLTPFSESPVTMTFPINGLEESLKPLREACGW